MPQRHSNAHQQWKRTLFNLLGTQLGWFACVWGAAQGMEWLGPLFALGYLPVHLAWLPNPRREIGFIILATLIGIAIEVFHVAVELLIYPAKEAWLPPLWMVALWLIFSSSIAYTWGWLQERYLLSAIIGGIAGPLTYLAGVQLGAATFGWPLGPTLIILMVIWALVMPTLVWLARRV